MKKKEFRCRIYVSKFITNNQPYEKVNIFRHPEFQFTNMKIEKCENSFDPVSKVH